MKPVLFLIDHLGHGGVQEFLVNYCERFRDGETAVVSLFKDDVCSERLRQAGANVTFLSDRRYSYTAVLDPRMLLTFLRFVRSRSAEYGTIHLKLFAAFFYASLLGLYRNPRVSAGLDCGSYQLSLPLRILYWLFARRYAHFYLHPTVRAEYTYLGLDSRRLAAHPCLVTERHSDTPFPFPNRYNFLSVGRCIAQKGHQDAIKLFADFQTATQEDAALYIVGDGPYLPELIALVPPKIRSRVHFVGKIINYSDYLIACTGVLKLARGEMANSVVREALFAGRPVASTLETEECARHHQEGLFFGLHRAGNQAANRASFYRLMFLNDEEREQLKVTARCEWPQGSVDTVMLGDNPLDLNQKPDELCLTANVS